MDDTDVIISLADPGWCQTDLGGQKAPNTPESAIPGIVVGAFISDKKSGRLFGAQDFTGLTLEEAVKKAELLDSPYNDMVAKSIGDDTNYKQLLILPFDN